MASTAQQPQQQQSTKQKKEKSLSSATNNKYSVLISKEFINHKNSNPNQINKDYTVDAILHQIKRVSTLKNIEFLQGMYVVKGEQEIKLTPSIGAIMRNIKYDNSNEKRLLSTNIELVSETQTIPKLMAYLEKSIEEYTTFLQNDMGDKLFFFTQMNMNDPLKYKNGQHESQVIFTKNLFTTHRSFNNIYFDQKDELVDRVNFFMERHDWYKKQGIAHTLGFMFHGVPGCGKTSTIKAIANVMGRHVINVNLAEIKTNTQLKNLFYNEELIITTPDTNDSLSNNNQKRVSLTIPTNKRLYVFEDIDCAGNVVLKRDIQQPTDKDLDEVMVRPQGSYFANKPKINQSVNSVKDESETDPITLSSLLNILDGTLEIPDRVIIFTTNHPDQLDTALIRPGRIDVTVKFTEASVDTTRQMYENFFERKLQPQEIKALPNNQHTPAEINMVLLRNFRKPEVALKELKTTIN